MCLIKRCKCAFQPDAEFMVRLSGPRTPAQTPPHHVMRQRSSILADAQCIAAGIRCDSKYPCVEDSRSHVLVPAFMHPDEHIVREICSLLGVTGHTMEQVKNAVGEHVVECVPIDGIWATLHLFITRQAGM